VPLGPHDDGVIMQVSHARHRSRFRTNSLIPYALKRRQARAAEGDRRAGATLTLVEDRSNGYRFGCDVRKSGQ